MAHYGAEWPEVLRKLVARPFLGRLDLARVADVHALGMLATLGFICCAADSHQVKKRATCMV